MRSFQAKFSALKTEAALSTDIVETISKIAVSSLLFKIRK